MECGDCSDVGIALLLLIALKPFTIFFVLKVIVIITPYDELQVTCGISLASILCADLQTGEGSHRVHGRKYGEV